MSCFDHLGRSLAWVVYKPHDVSSRLFARNVYPNYPLHGFREIGFVYVHVFCSAQRRHDACHQKDGGKKTADDRYIVRVPKNKSFRFHGGLWFRILALGGTDQKVAVRLTKVVRTL